jgi:molybdopterin-guanine dinucleotide biosynthesis adapter protein
MTPIISIVGKSDSGKTTLIEKLVPELIRRGYRVGTIKHDAHSFDIDHPGKDSWRHRQAGADTVVISSPAKAAIVTTVHSELTLDQIAAAYFQDVDVVITEGYKSENKPKIEILGEGSVDLISPANEVFLVAAASDTNGLDLPSVSRDDVASIADAIEDRFLKASRPAVVELLVDGKPIPLNAIMKAMVANTVMGMASSLKGVDSPNRLEVRLLRGKSGRSARR